METFILKAGTGLMQPCTSRPASLSTPHRRFHGGRSHLYTHCSLEFSFYVGRNSLKILNICIGKSTNCIDSRRKVRKRNQTSNNWKKGGREEVRCVKSGLAVCVTYWDNLVEALINIKCYSGYETFSRFTFVRVSLSFTLLNGSSLAFGLLVGQNKSI